MEYQQILEQMGLSDGEVRELLGRLGGHIRTTTRTWMISNNQAVRGRGDRRK